MASALTLTLPDEEATARLGTLLAGLLGPGDTVLLAGPLGAGKSHLARALIRARIGAAVEVPSPTFTLVQTYAARGGARGGAEGREAAGAGGVEIWHADLYRLSDPGEIAELGLDAAFESGICLVEWPERLGAAAPPAALRLRLDHAGEGRVAHLAGGRPGLLAAVAAGWGGDG